MDKAGRQILEIMRLASWYNRWLFSWLEPHLGESVLEVGSGIGNFTSMLLGKGRKVIATDVEQEYLQKIKSRIKSQNLRVIYGDVEKNEFKADPGRVDTIICLNVLEHIENDKQALGNMFNRLNKGGKLLLLVPAHPLLYGTLDRNLNHSHRYTKRELGSMLSDLHLTIADLRYLNWLGAIGWFINSRILRRKMLPSKQLGLFDKIARPFLILEKRLEPPFGLSILVVAQRK